MSRRTVEPGENLRVQISNGRLFNEEAMAEISVDQTRYTHHRTRVEVAGTEWKNLLFVSNSASAGRLVIHLIG
ncbi:hypothetical protein P171DRAFT_3357 [Karstenula rhodostoma CBS 690.94]|uniref:Uncharacterized protein n=1 Tax=Karstenula rhodostoma CBS 690.94 TaxID=1392251 RepID=A0A9P4PW33_9PLEO|nr:hypothetical protein P171DRAFT_3357 [Karstenula rhodostoma CBS 690.94]